MCTKTWGGDKPDHQKRRKEKKKCCQRISLIFDLHLYQVRKKSIIGLQHCKFSTINFDNIALNRTCKIVSLILVKPEQ